MWVRSLISRRVLLASIRLSKAFPIFFIATSSRVSEFVAELQLNTERPKKHEIKTQNTQKNRIKAFYTESNEKLPNDAISSTTDRLNRWSVLGSDLKEVSMDTVLHEFSAMSRKSFYFRM